jgi:hypothetical protein
MRRGVFIRSGLVGVTTLSVVACSSSDSPPSDGTGGASNGGSSNGGGAASGGSSSASGGSPSSGAASSAGGASSSGGVTSGGAAGNGETGGAGNAGSGGANATGGAAPGTGGTPVTPGAPITDRLSTATATVEEGVKAGVSNWRIWGTKPLVIAPVFTVPLADCGTLVGFTTSAGGKVTARVAHFDAADKFVKTMTLAADRELRGLAAEPDGHFAALLWDDAGDRIYVGRFDAAGAAGFDTELKNSDNHPNAFDIGDSRLEFGGGKYGAYYHVHSDSGHEGDTLKWISADAGAETTGWGWGCSHSMSAVLRFHPTLATFLPACVTDCYPGTSGDFAVNAQGGLYSNNSKKVLDIDGGCNGKVAGELGSAAVSADGWKLVFNAHQNPMTKGQTSYDAKTMNQDIGFAAVTGKAFTAGKVVWLTTTPGVSEANSSIASFSPDGDTTEQYLVGWAEPGTAAKYLLARVDGAGKFVENPVDLAGKARWGERDDPFRTQKNKDVLWAWFDKAGSTTLNLARVRSGAACTAN